MSSNNPTRSFGGYREAGDSRFTTRQSDWIGGYDRLYYQSVANRVVEPRFWDSYNIDSSTEGELKLCRAFEIVQSDGSNRLGKLLAWNNALYKIETQVGSPVVRKTTDGTTWTSLSMTGGPTTEIVCWTIWRGLLHVSASGSNTIYTLSTSDVWATPGQANPVGSSSRVIAMAVGADEKLLAWNSTGSGGTNSIFAGNDLVTWTNLWPPGQAASETFCDFMDDSTGAIIIATHDSAGSSLMEYFTPEGAATQGSMVTWLKEPNTWFYICEGYDGVAYLGSKRASGPSGSGFGQGVLWRKERGQSPTPVQEIGDGIRGNQASQDFGIHALIADADNLWIGAPMRTTGRAGVYWYNVDATGLESISPNSALSMTDLPDTTYAAAMFRNQLFISTSTGVYRRSAVNYVASGYLDSSIFDLRVPDHNKQWRFIEIILEDATPTEGSTVSYRTGTLTGAWLGGYTQFATGAKKFAFPNDNSAQGKYKLTSRQVQLRLGLQTGNPLVTPRITSLAVDASQIRPVGESY